MPKQCQSRGARTPKPFFALYQARRAALGSNLNPLGFAVWWRERADLAVGWATNKGHRRGLAEEWNERCKEEPEKEMLFHSADFSADGSCRMMVASYPTSVLVTQGSKFPGTPFFIRERQTGLSPDRSDYQGLAGLQQHGRVGLFP